MGMPDYYQVLGVARDADEKAIKSAYRKLATTWHPDKHQTSDEEKQKETEEKFKGISEAYTVLSDPEKKSNYDLTGDPKVGNAGFRTTGDMFDFFKGMGGFSNPGPRPPQAMRGQSIQYVMGITLVEALFGADKPVEYDTTSPCLTCNAKGGTEFEICPTCGGTGATAHRQQRMVMRTTCRDCRGEGEKVKKICESCKGQGTTSEHKKLTVQIPQGIHNGATLRIQGEGGRGLNGGPPGDLMIGLQVSMPDVSILTDEERKKLEELLSK